MAYNADQSAAFRPLFISMVCDPFVLFYVESLTRSITKLIVYCASLVCLFRVICGRWELPPLKWPTASHVSFTIFLLLTALSWVVMQFHPAVCFSTQTLNQVTFDLDLLHMYETEGQG